MWTLEKGIASYFSKITIEFFCLIFIIVLLSNVGLSLCEDNQIDINSASKGKLDELYGIGEVMAERIIDSRPFSSVEDLTRVKGIGEVTLDKIEDQDLACVEEEKGEEEKDYIEGPNEKGKIEESEELEKVAERPKIETESIINLNPEQNINTNNRKIIYESKDELIRNSLLLAFNVFLILIIAFLLFRK
jgi:competence ComEA-like helix-hairpin-helix protein